MTITRNANITGIGNSIVLQVINGASNQIVGSSYSIGGLHGTINQIGVIEQTTFNCTNTFKMYLSGTLSFTNGTNANYTTNVIIYGNIYNGQMALGGMVYDSNQVP